MRLIFCLLLAVSTLFAQNPVVTGGSGFNSVAFWNSPQNAAFSALAVKPVFAPSLVVYVRPQNTASAATFTVQAIVTPPNPSLMSPNIIMSMVINWNPQDGNAPDWVSASTALPLGTTLISVSIQMSSNAGTPPDALVK